MLHSADISPSYSKFSLVNGMKFWCRRAALLQVLYFRFNLKFRHSVPNPFQVQARTNLAHGRPLFITFSAARLLFFRS
jgi:hypothetical protein